ncbi:protein-export chaperone SecB [Pseudooceanicola spongiae]|jgi:preprotein translocase subunit SecB|uniref:Protein-export protein SecB n=1 Tax=Pseudooceanicola spongiae TaxID=2613965 RepID=A0A7L9WNQ5_9RHOB|nr:protein-export chaperone SecB [Pseudooceanicola spongiae]QOL82035.1 protein-export chaperone SecB [Pseudooceanicola spongiae]|tara:strand:+ start:415 stop:909 length:495 start_codon:yes stop_codon:yes gene_type:complete
MADDLPNGAAQQAPQVKMNVLTQYIRDMSFENILARKPATGQVQPDVKVQVALDAKKREADNQFEVLMKLTINSVAKDTGDSMFLMELEYVGIFAIEGVPDEQMHPFLLIECPRMLFPFVRRIVSDVTRDGGFPPLNLDTIDFVQLYRAELQRRAAAQPTAPAN